jgi:hypothetical protein
MNRHQLQTNLDGLCQNLEDYAEANGIQASKPPSPAPHLSDSLYLAHSTSDTNFSDICASGRLRPAISPRPDCAEVLLGTAGSVFFFVSPFRYPSTSCGLLFAKSLESDYGRNGAASPFDSGGLLKIFTRHEPIEPPRDFLSRHELPIPGHRRYLGLSMDLLFQQPRDYVDGLEPHWPGPIGLTGGDQRRWTHEVRIPDQVFVRGSHLQAVFATRARVAADPEIEDLFQWCAIEGVDRVFLDTPAGNDFEALRRACLDYIRGKLY